MKQDKQERHKQNEPTEAHHVIRLSLYGRDIPQNIVDLPKSEHILVHQKMEVGYNAVRNFRKRWNEYIVNMPEMWKDLTDLRMREFDKIDEVPVELQQKLVDKLVDQLNMALMQQGEKPVPHVQIKKESYGRKVALRAIERIGEIKEEKARRIMKIIGEEGLYNSIV